MEIMKFDDTLFIEEGFRREQIDKAVQLYELDKEKEPEFNLGGQEEGKEEEKEQPVAGIDMPDDGLKATGK